MNSKLMGYHMKLVCPPKLNNYIRLNATNITGAALALLARDDGETIILKEGNL